MSASYIFRMDDIAPAMDWGRFLALMQLFKRHEVRPLLGIVPDNRDPNLNRHPHRSDFWEVIRDLFESDAVDIAQHGYQHILVHRPEASILGPSVGIRKEVSEFAGDTLLDQSFRIREGQKILRRHGLYTSYWMAPNHSFDIHTLKALRANGFTALSDGIGLYPFHYHDLLFVPQTSWTPRWMPCGIHTICLHANSITPQDVKLLRLFLRRPLHFTRFSVVCGGSQSSPAHEIANHAYAKAYKAAWAIKRSLKARHAPVKSGHLAGREPQGITLQSYLAPPQP